MLCVNLGHMLLKYRADIPIILLPGVCLGGGTSWISVGPMPDRPGQGILLNADVGPKPA